MSAELDAAFAMPSLECAVALAKRRERLSMDAPICRKCGDEQVQLFDWLASPALWKCRRCGHFWPDERASNAELRGRPLADGPA